MPKFRVILQPEAERNVADIFAWLSERSRPGAGTWYLAFQRAIERLRESADQLPQAPESPHFDRQVRDILFKTSRGKPYRMLFTIQASEVNVLYIRGPGQDLVRAQRKQV